MRRVLKAALFLFLLAAAFGIGWIASGIGVGRSVPVSSLEDRERRFVERMRDVVLDGHFTVAWPEPREGSFRDRYEVAAVTRLDGNRWRFDARITYGEVDVTLPVVVPLLWAGETPMIRLVDAEIPGLGSEFGATVVFDGDRYAGTWDHGEVGGFLFGTITRSGTDAAAELPPPIAEPRP